MKQSSSWKLIVPQRIKNFFAFCGTWKFITTFARAYYLSVSWARSVHSTLSHPVGWTYILILSSHRSLGLTSGRFPSAFPTESFLISSPLDVAFEWVVLFLFQEVECSSLYQGDGLVGVFLVVLSVSRSRCRVSKRVPCLAMAGSFNMFPTSSFTNFNIVFLHIQWCW